MSAVITELRTVEDVPSVTNNEVSVYMTPTSGKDIIILEFSGEAAFDPNAAVRLVWKFDHATEAEENIWSIKGSGKLPHKALIPAADVDGVRKLAIVLNNDMSSGSIFLAGYALIRQV